MPHLKLPYPHHLWARLNPFIYDYLCGQHSNPPNFGNLIFVIHVMVGVQDMAPTEPSNRLESDYLETKSKPGIMLNLKQLKSKNLKPPIYDYTWATLESPKIGIFSKQNWDFNLCHPCNGGCPRCWYPHAKARPPGIKLSKNQE